MDRGEEVFRYKTPRRMTALGPWIGKHDVKRRDGILREQLLDGIGNLESQDARIRQTGALDFSTGRPHSTQQTLDSQEIFGRIFGRDGLKKRAVAAAKVYFDRGTAAVDRLEIERRETIGRDEFRLACYGC